MRMNLFGTEIRKQRERAGLSEEEVVEHIIDMATHRGIDEFSCSHQSLSRYERGKNIAAKKRQDLIDLLETLFDVPEGYLHALYESDRAPIVTPCPLDLIHGLEASVERWTRDLGLIRDNILDGAAEPGRQQLDNLEADIWGLIVTPGLKISSPLRSRAYDVLAWTILEHGEAATFCMTREEAFACHTRIATKLSHLHGETGHDRFRDLSRLINAFAHYAIGDYDKAFMHIRPRLDLDDLRSPFWEMLALRIELLSAIILGSDRIAKAARNALNQFVQNTQQDYSRFLALEALARDLAYRQARGAFAKLEEALALNPPHTSLRLAGIRTQLEIMCCLQVWDVQQAAYLQEKADWIAGPNQWFASQIGRDAQLIIAKADVPLEQYCAVCPGRFRGQH